MAWAGGGSSITGDYVEIRSCDVYTGPCFANGEMGLTGEEAILTWSVDQGSWEGVALDGLNVIAVVRASATLGRHQPQPLSRQGRRHPRPKRRRCPAPSVDAFRQTHGRKVAWPTSSTSKPTTIESQPHRRILRQRRLRESQGGRVDRYSNALPRRQGSRLRKRGTVLSLH